MKTHKFARKPFYVDAVRVSEANIEQVAEWCGGTIITDHDDGIHIQVKVHRPITDRQTMAFIGDWVLWAGNGFKVYTPKAFDKAFEKVRTLSKEQADQAGIKVPHEPKSSTKGFKAKKAPVPAPPKAQGDPKAPFRVVTEAKVHSVNVVAEEPNPEMGVHPIEEVREVPADTPASDAEVQENAVKAAPKVIAPKNDPVSKFLREVEGRS